MVKLTIEERDIIKMIKDKYPGAEILGEVLKDIEVTIRLEEFQPTQTKTQNINQDLNNYDKTKYFKDAKGKLVGIPEAHRPRPVVVDGDNIDAKASGLTLEPRKETVPGKSMGRGRGRLPKF